MSVPKVFISYSHDSLEHKKWVMELATRLRNNGIDAILDQFDLRAGDDIPHFMEKNLESANKILMICTKNYISKANGGKGGVGYEKMIVTSHLMKRIDENKVIPIIKQKGLEINTPTFLRTKLYIDFSSEQNYEFSYDELVRTILNSPLFEKPPIGNNPFKPINKNKLDSDIELIHKVIKGISNVYNFDSQPSSMQISNDIKISRILVEIGIKKLVDRGLAKFTSNSKSYVVLTDEGKVYAYENEIVK